MSKGNTTWTYTYDANGIRIKCTNGISDFTYIYNGDKLVRLLVDSYEYFDLTFTYDANGTPLTITERGLTYYYVTNLQGDVLGIKDSSGQQFITYSYDAWGNLLYRTNTPLADYNPLRYRGYVYDFETGLYYLQSRYYDPEMGRFINGDCLINQESAIGNNMFAYCGNNPIINADPTGFLFEKNAGGGAAFPSGGGGGNGDYYYGSGEVISVQESVAIAATAAFLCSLSIEALREEMFYIHNNSSFQATIENAKKPVNLPSWKKLQIDKEHILSGHTPGGSRNPKGNKTVFYGMSAAQIWKAIEEAYQNCSKLKTQDCKVLLRGYSQTYKLTIQFWVNLIEYIIETAYPES